MSKNKVFVAFSTLNKIEYNIITFIRYFYCCLFVKSVRLKDSHLVLRDKFSYYSSMKYFSLTMYIYILLNLCCQESSNLILLETNAKQYISLLHTSLAQIQMIQNLGYTELVFKTSR